MFRSFLSDLASTSNDDDHCVSLWNWKTVGRSTQLAFYDKFLADSDNRLFGNKFDVYRDIHQSNLSAADKMTRLNSFDLIERNFLRVNVIFGQRGLERLNNTPSITWIGLASNIGGGLSLWIGVSVMTVIELIELLYRITRMALFARSVQIADNAVDRHSETSL